MINRILSSRLTLLLFTIFFTIIPGIDYYSKIFINLYKSITIPSFTFNLDFSVYDFLPSLLSGIALGLLFYLYIKSRQEYALMKKEFQKANNEYSIFQKDSRRIKEILITHHLINNNRFHRIQQKNFDKLFDNEEHYVKKNLRRQLSIDTGHEYTDEEVDDVLDRFYRQKPKFFQPNKATLTKL
ncbi:MAG: hypothetical protein K9G76_00990 [Bacteroidales bacterium]|nr:hypothetical protein [Bacteroidales bacterium]MCF8402690.1 hypothetical protein [Bacteroidales bacterium]